MDFTKKNAIIVGGVTGIGLACAKSLLQSGLKGLAIIDYNSSVFGDLKSEFASDYGSKKILFFEADISDETQIRKAFNDAKLGLGSIDIVLNNAAILAEKIWEKMIDINMKGIIYGTKLAAELLNKGGVVINTCSIASLLPHYWLPVYSSTKTAVLTFTRCLASHERAKPTGIRYLMLCPGGTNTPLRNGINKFGVIQEHINAEEMPKILLQDQEPEDVARVFIRMLKEATNGAVWLVNGRKAYDVCVPQLEDCKLTELDIS